MAQEMDCQQSHNQFYAFLKALGTGKPLGDPRGYRKDIPKVAIAYSNFYLPLGGMIAFQYKINGARINVPAIAGESIFSRNIVVGGPISATETEWHDLEPGSCGDFFWKTYTNKPVKYVDPNMYNWENFAGTFIPIKSALDLPEAFNPIYAHTENEEELAALSPFNAVYYMRDPYNDYVRFRDSSQLPTYTPNDKRYQHIIFDNQLMTALMLGLKALEDVYQKKIITLPIYPLKNKTFTIIGPDSVSPVMRTPFKYNGPSSYFTSYTSTLPIGMMTKLSDGVARLYEGNFDRDTLTDVLMVQGHNWTASTVLLSNPNSDKKLIPYNFTRPEMTEGAKITVADFNGDGMDDILTFGNPSQSTLLVDLCNGDGTFTSVRQSASSFIIWAMQPEVKIVTADFNNDRMVDIVLIGGNDWNNIRVAWSKGDGTFIFQTITGTTEIAWQAVKKGARIMAGTFQGKNEMSLAVAAGNMISIASFVDGSAHVTSKVLTSFSDPGNLPFWSWIAEPQVSVITADFNGDGLTDIALTGVPGWGSIPVAFSTGDGNFKITNKGLDKFPRWHQNPMSRFPLRT